MSTKDAMRPYAGAFFEIDPAAVFHHQEQQHQERPKEGENTGMHACVCEWMVSLMTVVVVLRVIED